MSWLWVWCEQLSQASATVVPTVMVGNHNYELDKPVAEQNYEFLGLNFLLHVVMCLALWDTFQFNSKVVALYFYQQ